MLVWEKTFKDVEGFLPLVGSFYTAKNVSIVSGISHALLAFSENLINSNH